MTSKTLRIVAAVCALAGLVASAALFAPYVSGHAFCRPGGGCDQVAQSSYATVMGIPRAAIGVVAFAGLLAIAIFRGQKLRTASAVLGAAFAVEGAHLLFVQAFILHAICPFCVVVDVSSIVAGAVLLADFAMHRAEERVWLAPARFSALGVAAAFAPMLLAVTQPRALSTSKIEKLAPADGKLVLREFVDLECPFCRKTHVALKKALAGRTDIIVERRHVPLSMHQHAETAAVAACCAAEQGAEDKFVDAIVSLEEPPDEPACRKIALTIGLDSERYDACRKSERPKKRIEADVALASQLKVEGLPTIDFDGERHIGALDDERAAAFLARHVH
ncbi:MAG: vitamin K epoxide reductase family protein [Polyangiales bacterium]